MNLLNVNHKMNLFHQLQMPMHNQKVLPRNQGKEQIGQMRRKKNRKRREDSSMPKNKQRRQKTRKRRREKRKEKDGNKDKPTSQKSRKKNCEGQTVSVTRLEQICFKTS